MADEVGVVVLGLLAPKGLKQKPPDELSVTWRERSALTSSARRPPELRERAHAARQRG